LAELVRKNLRSDDTITEVESHNQSIDDHLSTETEEDMHADVVEQTYNADDFKTTSSSSSSSSHGDQESNFESHCINLVKDMGQVACIDHDERVRPPTTTSSLPSSKQSSSCNYLSTNHSDLALPDLNHNYCNNTLLGELSCSDDDPDKSKAQSKNFVDEGDGGASKTIATMPYSFEPTFKWKIKWLFDWARILWNSSSCNRLHYGYFDGCKVD
jgi:hypothetical protein